MLKQKIYLGSTESPFGMVQFGLNNLDLVQFGLKKIMSNKVLCPFDICRLNNRLKPEKNRVPRIQAYFTNVTPNRVSNHHRSSCIMIGGTTEREPWILGKLSREAPLESSEMWLQVLNLENYSGLDNQKQFDEVRKNQTDHLEPLAKRSSTNPMKLYETKNSNPVSPLISNKR